MKKKLIAILLLPILAASLLFAYVSFRYIIWQPTGREAAQKAGMPYPAVIAHRGASYMAPEETEPAYILARDMGADYLEMDVHRTKDNEIIAMHDECPARTTNLAKIFPGREKDNIEKFTLAELKQLDAGSWFNETHPDRARKSYAGQKILTLDEVVTIAESGALKPSIYIETKSPSHYPGYETQIVEILKKRGWIGNYPDTGRAKTVFQSFDKTSLERLKELAPEAPRTYLVGAGMVKDMGWEAFSRDAANFCSCLGPVGYICWPWNDAKAHSAGLVIHPYTANAGWQYAILGYCGADGFFTDRCDVLMRHYGRKLAAKPDAIFTKYNL
jgi:glycerophosphoryl diester phosphodiesterase